MRERQLLHILHVYLYFFYFINIFLFKKEDKNTNKQNNRIVKYKCTDLASPALERYQARHREVDECFISAHPPTLSLLKNRGIGSSESV